MNSPTLPHPPITSRAAWLRARLDLLKQEKELTQHYDRVSAERRRLPMVPLDKDYVFEGPGGKCHLRDLFDGRPQLIVYHFMFDPSSEHGCPGCTGFVDALGSLSLLPQRRTTFTLISRAPLAKLEALKARKGWKHGWVSSFGSDFNYDFHVTLDAKVAPMEYNFRPVAPEAPGAAAESESSESHGISVFFLHDRQVYHTYSAYARGVERLTDDYSLLDLTPYGRQEDWESSPAGWPQRPTYGG